MRAPRSGRITDLRCSPGQEIASGSSPLSIDGEPVAALAISRPLWRSLAPGDRGADALSLNSELRRLGYSAPDSDRVSKTTVRAFRSLLDSLGADGSTVDLIDMARVIWLPGDAVTIARCEAETGEDVDEQTVIAETAGSVEAVPVSLPVGIPGERDVVLSDGTRIPVSDEGRVIDPAAIERLLMSDDFAHAVADESGARQVAGSWALREGIDVAVVPPSSIVSDASGSTCVIAADRSAVLVDVVGSELGQSFVTTSDETTAPADVIVAPGDGRVCR